MKRFQVMAAVLAVGVLFSACSQAPAEVKGGLGPQFGTKLNDRADAVVTDAKRGYTYVGGVTEPGINDESFFLRSFDVNGKLRWERRINCCYADFAEVDAVRLDGAGNVYMSYSGDDYDDGDKFGFVIKVSSANKLLYKFSVENSIKDFEVDRVGNVYLTGVNVGTPEDDIYPSFLRKYDIRGKLAWERLNADGTTNNEIPSPLNVALASDGSLYVTGYSYPQTVLTKYSNTGRTLWQKPLVDDYTDVAVTAAGGDVYLARNTGEFPGDPNNVIIQKYRSNGSVSWQKTFATRAESRLTSSATDVSGNLYVAGFGFARKYTSLGALSWVYAPRPTNTADVRDIAVGSGRAIYLIGTTVGKVNGTNSGNDDAFLVQLDSKGQKVWER